MGISGIGASGTGGSYFYSAQKPPSNMIKQQAEQSPQSENMDLPKTATVPQNAIVGELNRAPTSTDQKSPAQTATEAEQNSAQKKQLADDTDGCETCENRTYQDGSNDPSVSFKNPTNVDPSVAASAVRGHEQEHVFNERNKAQREQRKIISQTVSLHNGICGECGKAYISGGTTRTVSKADNSKAVEQYKKNSQAIA